MEERDYFGEISFEIKESKTGLPIPVINGIHLHSTYDPEREAQKFCTNYDHIFSKKNKILVLGLGFGHHVIEIMNTLNRFHDGDFEISVIEPLIELVNEAIIQNPRLTDSRIKIYSSKKVDRLYANKNLISFFMKKPSVVAHPPSFNLFKDFYKSYLTYKAPNLLNNIVTDIENDELSFYLKEFSQEFSIEKCVNYIKNNKTYVENRLDFFLLAFDEITHSKTIVEASNE